MTQTRRRIALACLCVAGLLFLSSLGACPFCLSPPQTFVEQMSRADIVVIGELLRFRVLDNGTFPESTLRIREVLRGKQISQSCPSLAVGQVVVVSKEAAGKTGDLFLLYGDLPVRASDSQPVQLASGSTSEVPVQTATFSSSAENSKGTPQATSFSAHSSSLSFTEIPLPETETVSKSSVAVAELVSWNDVSQVSMQTVEYLRSLPDKSVPHVDRLRFYLDYLEHPEAMVAIDAWAEFGNSKYEEVAAVRQDMPREKLRSWIADPAASPERLGVYGMMLGLCGQPEDAEFLLSQMVESPLPHFGEALLSEELSGIPGSSLFRMLEYPELDSPTTRQGSDGLLGGYLLLSGASGLDVLDTMFPKRDGLAYSYCTALQFIWSYEAKLIDANRMRASMRKLIQADEVQELAITNLCRWEDWTVLPELQSGFSNLQGNDSKRAVIEFTEVYLRATARSGMDSSQKEPCEKFLAEARESHPQLFSARFGEFGPPKP